MVWGEWGGGLGGGGGVGAVGECSWETVHPMEEAFCYRPHECFWTMLLCVTLPVMKFCELKDVVACMHSQSRAPEIRDSQSR